MNDDTVIRSWLQEARSYASRGKHLHAVQIYRRVTTADPTLEAAWVELAHVYLHLRRLDAAETALQQALVLADDPTQILYSLAALHRESGNAYEATRYYRRLLLRERALPKNIRAQLHYDLGVLYRERKNVRMAEHHLRILHRLDPTYPRVAGMIAEILVHRSALSDATKFLRRAIAAEPHDWSAHMLLGQVHAKRGEWEDALEALNTAIGLDPDEPRGWHLCGSVLLAMHRLEESEPYLRKAVALDPKSVDALVDLGLLSLRTNALKQASDYFLRALNVQPGNRRARDGQRELTRLRNAQ